MSGAGSVSCDSLAASLGVLGCDARQLDAVRFCPVEGDVVGPEESRDCHLKAAPWRLCLYVWLQVDATPSLLSVCVDVEPRAAGARRAPSTERGPAPHLGVSQPLWLGFQ